MRILLTGILIFVNFILQTTLLPYISIGGILPNTALIIVVSYALLRGSTEGAIVGFFSGLPIDIFFGTSFGYYTLLFLLAGLLIGRSQKDFYRENYLLPIIICSLAAIVYESIIFITGFSSREIPRCCIFWCVWHCRKPFTQRLSPFPFTVCSLASTNGWS